MKNKKILFVIPSFFQGGGNRSLCSLLPFLKDNRFEFSIYCLNPIGSFKDSYKEYNVIKTSFFMSLFSRVFFRKLLKLFRILLHVHVEKIVYYLECNFNKNLNSFDTVIAFQEDSPTHFACFLKGRKIAWMHSDMQLHYDNLDIPFQWDVNSYKCYDKIVCVSKSIVETFLRFIPDVNDRITYLYNVIDVNNVRYLSMEQTQSPFIEEGSFSIVSVGRICDVKRFDKIPFIVKKIKDLRPNLKLRWYIIGPLNSLSEQIQIDIDKLGLSDSIILLGEKKNPYPYIKKSNLLACISYSESWSYVLNEALTLHVPVLSTDFSAAYEVIPEGLGIICRYEDLCNQIIDIVQNKNNIYTDMRARCLSFEYSNHDIIKKFYELMQ